MIIKIATMHGETHLTFMVEWIRVLRSLWRGDPSGSLQRMDREALCYRAANDVSVNKRERGDEGDDWLSKLPTASPQDFLIRTDLCLSVRLLRSSDDSNHPSVHVFFPPLHPSGNVLALCAFFNQRITRDSFRPSLDIIKWLTASLHPLSTTPPLPPHPDSIRVRL